MTAGQFDERVLLAHRDIKHIIGANAGGMRRAAGNARDRLAALDVPDVEDVATWPGYNTLTNDLRVLLCILEEAELPTSDPPRFRALILGVLRYVHLAGHTSLGLVIAKQGYLNWVNDLGSADRDSLAAGVHYATFLQSEEGSPAALPLFVEVLQSRVRILGWDHPDTLDAEASLCGCQLGLKDYATAARLSEQNVRHCARAIGPESDITLRATTTFADANLELGRDSVALAALQDIHATFLRTRGPDHFRTLQAAENLARALHRTGAYEAAEAINRDLVERYKTQQFEGAKEGGDRAFHGLHGNLEAMGRSYWDEEAAAGRPSPARSPDEED